MKIVAISDTHMQHSKLKLPQGDILIHAGDALNWGTDKEWFEFLAWFRKQPYEHKIFVAGNHDLYVQNYNREARESMEMAGITYLQDSGVVIDRINFWGYPHTPPFGKTLCFMEDDEVRQRAAEAIEGATDVLISHGPALGYLDQILPEKSENLGCPILRDQYARLPTTMVHMFGHIHGSHGMQLTWPYQDEPILMANLCICDERYKPVNPPTVIHL
jgi:Icc-related predicted phosphoesterase